MLDSPLGNGMPGFDVKEPERKDTGSRVRRPDEYELVFTSCLMAGYNKKPDFRL